MSNIYHNKLESRKSFYIILCW